MVLNKLHINMTKCCYIHFKPKTSTPVDPTLVLKIQDFPVKKVDSTKFLGVVIDEKICWEPHVAALRRKLNYASSTLYRTRGKSPDNVNFCQPVIIRNQIYSQYNLTFDLPHQKTSVRTKVTDDQNASPKLTTNTSFNSTIVFYLPIRSYHVLFTASKNINHNERYIPSNI